MVLTHLGIFLCFVKENACQMIWWRPRTWSIIQPHICNSNLTPSNFLLYANKIQASNSYFIIYQAKTPKLWRVSDWLWTPLLYVLCTCMYLREVGGLWQRPNPTQPRLCEVLVPSRAWELGQCPRAPYVWLGSTRSLITGCQSHQPVGGIAITCYHMIYLHVR